MASIQMNMGTETEINATPNKDGLILFDTTNKKIILDNNGTREVLTKHIEANPNLNGAEQLENLKVNGEVLNFLPVDISNVEKDGEEISDILEDKYNTEGDYNTTVDKCTDLTRVTPVTDNAPYIYRQTPVKESFKALMKKIVGASVVWNQMLRPITSDYWGGYNASTSFSNGVCSLTATAQGGNVSVKSGYRPNILANHIYIGSVIVKANENYNNVRFSWASGIKAIDTNITTSWTKYIVVFKYNSDYANSINAVIDRNTSDFKEIQFKEFWQTDLTAMFGTTIADYVYTLETAEAGTGIAWLQSYGFFTEDYYAYKQNKLESGCVSAKKIYGKNLVFSKIEHCNISNGGLLQSYSSTQYDMHIAKVRANTTYTLKTNDNTFVGGFFTSIPEAGSTTYNEQRVVSTTTFTAPIDGYVAFRSEYGYSMAQLEFGSTATPYEPYTETTYPISPITLRGLFKLSTDKLTVDGDEYNADGSVKRKYGTKTIASSDVVNVGISYTNVKYYKIAKNSDMKTYGSYANQLLLNTLGFAQGISSGNWDNASYINTYITSAETNSIWFGFAPNTTIEQAQGILNNASFIYEKATPTTEQTTPFTETEIVGSTEEFIDYEVAQSNRDVAIPVGTETEYYQSYNISPIPFTDCYLSASNQNLGWVSNS